MQVKSRIAVILPSSLAGACVAADIFVVRPMSWGGTAESYFEKFQSLQLVALTVSTALWVVISVIAIMTIVSRLGHPSTWSWNRPFSPWRTTRGALVALGVVCAGSLVPSVLGLLSDAAPTQSASTIAPLIGFVALALGGLMYAIGGAARLEERREMVRP